MTRLPSKSEAPIIKAGEIYRSVIGKRLDFADAEAVADLELAKVEGEVLTFSTEASARRAMADGVFLLEIPYDLDLLAGDQFAETFYRGKEYGGYGRYRLLNSENFADPLLGFHQRSDQIEQFLLERRFWECTFPPEIRLLGEQLTNLSSLILNSILDLSGLPQSLYVKATGGCSLASGSYHLTFNHYRPIEERVGLSSHKDDGFVTILRTKSAGLEINRRNYWELVPTSDNHLVINFGLAMEILTNKCTVPVSAIMHRVKRQSEDRHSFGHFSSSKCDVNDSSGIYRFDPPDRLGLVCGSRELINANDAEIYLGTTTEAPQ
jgi:hypothetical protein